MLKKKSLFDRVAEGILKKQAEDENKLSELDTVVADMEEFLGKEANVDTDKFYDDVLGMYTRRIPLGAIYEQVVHEYNIPIDRAIELVDNFLFKHTKSDRIKEASVDRIAEEETKVDHKKKFKNLNEYEKELLELCETPRTYGKMKQLFTARDVNNKTIPIDGMIYKLVKDGFLSHKSDVYVTAPRYREFITVMPMTAFTKEAMDYDVKMPEAYVEKAIAYGLDDPTIINKLVDSYNVDHSSAYDMIQKVKAQRESNIVDNWYEKEFGKGDLGGGLVDRTEREEYRESLIATKTASIDKVLFEVALDYSEFWPIDVHPKIDEATAIAKDPTMDYRDKVDTLEYIFLGDIKDIRSTIYYNFKYEVGNLFYDTDFNELHKPEFNQSIDHFIKGDIDHFGIIVSANMSIDVDITNEEGIEPIINDSTKSDEDKIRDVKEYIANSDYKHNELMYIKDTIEKQKNSYVDKFTYADVNIKVNRESLVATKSFRLNADGLLEKLKSEAPVCVKFEDTGEYGLLTKDNCINLENVKSKYNKVTLEDSYVELGGLKFFVYYTVPSFSEVMSVCELITKESIVEIQAARYEWDGHNLINYETQEKVDVGSLKLEDKILDNPDDVESSFMEKAVYTLPSNLYVDEVGYDRELQAPILKVYKEDSREAKKLQQKKANKQAASYVNSIGNNFKLNAQNIAHQAVAFTRKFLSNYRFPAAPQIKFNAIKNASTENDVLNGDVNLTLEFRTLSAVKKYIDISLPVKQGNFIEPSTMTVDGQSFIISQSAIDDITKNGTFYANVNPKGMGTNPMHRNVMDSFKDKKVPKIKRNLFSV